MILAWSRGRVPPARRPVARHRQPRAPSDSGGEPADVGDDAVEQGPGLFGRPVRRGNALDRLERRVAIDVIAHERRQRAEGLGFPAADERQREHRRAAGRAFRILLLAGDLVERPRFGRLQVRPLEDDVALGVDDPQGKSLESLAEGPVGAVVNDDRIDRDLGAEVDLPPRVPRVLLGVGLAPGAIFAGGLAVDGLLGVAAVSGVFLRGPALAGQVAAVAQDFNFGEGKRPCARQLDPHEAARGLLRYRLRGQRSGQTMQERL